MTRVRGLLALAGLLLAGAGCNTYHYFDVQVSFGALGVEEAGGIKACQVVVTGADTYDIELPPTTQGAKMVCPIGDNYPDLGTFEYSTFTDSGNLTFTLNAFNTTQLNTNNICISGSTTLPASSAITHTGMITLTQGSQSCITNQGM